MQNIIKFLICVGLLFACQEESKKIQFSGTITNNTNDYALFVSDTTGIGLSLVIDTIKFDKTGKFNFESNILKSDGLLVLFTEQKPLKLVIPKELVTTVEIGLDLQKPDSIKILGNQARFIKYNLDQQKYQNSIIKTMSDKHSVFASGDNSNLDFHKIQDTITDLRLNYLKDYFKDSNLENQRRFIKSQGNSLIFSNLYYRMSGQKFDIVQKLQFYGKSDKALTYSERIDFSDQVLFTNRDFVEFMNDAISTIVRYENPSSDLSSYELYLNNGFEVIDNLYEDNKTNQVQKIVYLNYLITKAKRFKKSINISEFQKAIERMKSQEANGNLELVEFQLRQAENSMSKFAVGKVAPDFEVESIDGKKYKSSDFANKLVFIDVWASWCGPCISSFPKWNKLIEDYSNMDEIAFLTVSLDDDRSKWKNALEKLSLSGLKLYAGNKAFDSEFATSFEIKSLPSYIAIDEKGKILSISSSINEFEEIIKKKLSE